METSLELWNQVVAVNQTGPFLGMRAAIPACGAPEAARSSTSRRRSATSGTASPCRYTAAKGALTALTRTVAVELAPRASGSTSCIPA